MEDYALSTNQQVGNVVYLSRALVNKEEDFESYFLNPEELPSDPLSLGNPQTYGAYFFNYSNLRVSNSQFRKFQDSFNPLNRGLITRGFSNFSDYNSNYATIDNNSFDGMKYAFQAERSNSNTRLRCNSFNNTQSGGYPWHIAPQFAGFFPDQGEGCEIGDYRPGNYFLEEETEHIFSNAWNPWVYYGVNLQYRRPAFATNPLFGSTDPCDNANNEPCPTSSGPGWTAAQAIAVIKTSKANQGTIKNAQDSIRALLDQGKTLQMVNLVEDVMFPVSDLTDSLMLHQPLSDAVLLALTERESLLSHAQLKMVLSPNLPASDSIMQPLFEFINRKHPSVKDTLFGLQIYNPSFTTIASLEREKRAEKYNELEAVQYVESMFIDSLEFDKLIALYRDTLSADSSYLLPLLGTYLAADSVTSARSLLEELHIQEFITESFYNYYDLVVGLSEDTITWLQLDSNKVALLKAIASEDSDLALYALAALELRGDTVIKRHPEDNYGGPSGRYSSPEEDNTVKFKTTKFTLYPNPSQNFIILESNTRFDELCNIEIFDIAGRLILTSQIDFKERNTNKVNLNGINSGIYFCRILKDNKQLEVIMFIHQP